MCFNADILSFQLKDMAEKLPPGVYDPESLKLVYLPNGLEPNGILYPDSNGETNSRTDQISNSYLVSHPRIDSATSKGRQMPSEVLSGDDVRSNESNSQAEGIGLSTANRTNDGSSMRIPNGGGSVQANRSSVSEGVITKESGPNPDGENGSRSGNSDVLVSASQIEAEWIEQYEPGVYITLVAFRDGTRDLKRVRFRYLRYSISFCNTCSRLLI